MADSKISALSAVTTPASTDVVPIVNGGVTKKVTIANLVANAAPSLLTLGTASTTTGSLILANSSSAFLTTIQAGNSAAARTYIWPTNFGAAGGVLTDATGNGTLSWVVPSTGLTIGSTAIASGTTTRILYDNAGTLGEYTISGTGTVVAMAAGPTFTTPTLGVATATSLNGNTLTAGTYTLTGAAAKVFTFNNTLTLAGTDGSTLNVGAGGTLGTNAYTSTAYAPLASPTFSGTVTSGGTTVLTGNTTISVGGTTSAQTDLLINPTTKASGNYVDIKLGGGATVFAVSAGNVMTTPPTVSWNNVAGSPGLNGAYVGILRLSDVMNLNAYAGWIFYDTQGSATRMNLTQVGNLKIAGVAVRGTTEGTNHLDIFDGTAPIGTLANGISLYSTAGELRVMDSAGNATLLSPHDHRTNEWIYYSVNTVTGKVLKIDMERMMRTLDAKLGGGFVHEYMSEVEARPDLRKAN